MDRIYSAFDDLRIIFVWHGLKLCQRGLMSPSCGPIIEAVNEKATHCKGKSHELKVDKSLERTYNKRVLKKDLRVLKSSWVSPFLVLCLVYGKFKSFFSIIF